MVVSVFFLSLGAPFWFNVLKNVTSLRSVVAQKESPAGKPAPEPAGKPAPENDATATVAESRRQLSLSDLPERTAPGPADRRHEQPVAK